MCGLNVCAAVCTYVRTQEQAEDYTSEKDDVTIFFAFTAIACTEVAAKCRHFAIRVTYDGAVGVACECLRFKF